MKKIRILLGVGSLLSVINFIFVGMALVGGLKTDPSHFYNAFMVLAIPSPLIHIPLVLSAILYFKDKRKNKTTLVH